MTRAPGVAGGPGARSPGIAGGPGGAAPVLQGVREAQPPVIAGPQGSKGVWGAARPPNIRSEICVFSLEGVPDLISHFSFLISHMAISPESEQPPRTRHNWMNSMDTRRNERNKTTKKKCSSMCSLALYEKHLQGRYRLKDW